MPAMTKTMPWRAVTLDATGTLFRPRESIGKTYALAWERVTCVELSPAQREAAARVVNARFPAAFRLLSASEPNFGSGGGGKTAFPWWKRLVLGVVNDPEAFPSAPLARELEEPLARALYEQFADPDAWAVYADARPALERLKAQDVALGVISNFDERLGGILRGHGLDAYFDLVTTSFELGRAKPDAAIFETTFDALLGATSLPSEASGRYEQCLHVGDNRVKDCDGARAAGASARLLVRHPERRVEVEKEQSISTLLDLFEAKLQ